VAPNKAESPAADSREAQEIEEAEETIGSFITEARKRLGLSPEDVVDQAGIPAHYVRMIEQNDYRLVADQVYLLPFVRRYAEFLRLDAEGIAARFIRETRRADANAVRIARPMEVTPRKPRRRLRRIVLGVLLLAMAALLAQLAWHYLNPMGQLPLNRAAASAVEPATSPGAAISRAAARLDPIGLL